MICPYCENPHHQEAEDDNEHEEVCAKCGETFLAYDEATVTHYARKKPNDQTLPTEGAATLKVVSLGDLYADACAVCCCHGYYGLASVYGPEGCVEAVRNGRVYCELHLPRDSQPNR